MSLEQQARNVAAFIGRRRGLYGDEDDARQEAAAALLALPNPKGATAFFGAVHHVGRQIDRWRAPVSIGDRGANARVVVLRAGRAEVAAPACDPSVVVDAIRWETLRAALHLAERHATRGLPSFVRAMGQALQERGRYWGLHADLAEENGLTRYQVIRALGRWRRTANQSRDVQQLKARLVQFEEEIRT